MTVSSTVDVVKTRVMNQRQVYWHSAASATDSEAPAYHGHVGPLDSALPVAARVLRTEGPSHIL